MYTLFICIYGAFGLAFPFTMKWIFSLIFILSHATKLIRTNKIYTQIFDIKTYYASELTHSFSLPSNFEFLELSGFLFRNSIFYIIFVLILFIYLIDCFVSLIFFFNKNMRLWCDFLFMFDWLYWEISIDWFHEKKKT